MNDINAFERLVADVTDDLMGPSRSFDTVPIVQSAKTMAPRRWTDVVQRIVGDRFAPMEGSFSMFSAVKFVAAGVIVALFGGFLLAGVLTTQQDGERVPAAMTASPPPETEAPTRETEPTTEPEPTGEPTTRPVTAVRTDILPGVELVTEEIDPGIVRVLSDGVRDLPVRNADRMVAGPDGSTWFVRSKRFFRLGDDTTHAWPEGQRDQSDVVLVGSDGTVWIYQSTSLGGHKQKTTIRSFDGAKWTTHQDVVSRRRSNYKHAIVIAGDGTVWASWPDPRNDEGDDATIVARLGPDGWQRVGRPLEAETDGTVRLFVDADGAVSVSRKGKEGRHVYRYADGAWQERLVPRVGSSVAGPDGTTWSITYQPLRVDGECVIHSYSGWANPVEVAILSRFDGSEWTTWEWGLPRGIIPYSNFGAVVSPDGSIWIGNGLYDGTETNQAGVTRFDGTTWQRFVPGHSVRSIDFAVDGSAWLRVTSPDEREEWLFLDLEDAIPSGAYPAVVTERPVPVSEPQPEPSAEPAPAPVASTRTDILPGVALRTEELEPGVLRIVHDGARDLEWDPRGTELAAGPDGSVWFRKNLRLLRLGDSTKRGKILYSPDLEVAPDGTVWRITQGEPDVSTGGPASIRSFDGKRWTVHMESRKRNPRAIEVAPDGRVWALWLERDSTNRKYRPETDAVFGYLDAKRWNKVGRWPNGEGEWPRPDSTDLVVTDDGDIWGFAGREGPRRGSGTSLSRYVDGSWEEMVAADVSGSKTVGPDGTVWIVDDAVLRADDPAAADVADGPFLRRFDGSEWQVWDVGDGIPIAEDWLGLRLGAVSPDGALWLEPSHLLIGEDCSPQVLAGGLVRFDGTTADHFLRGYGIRWLDFGPDGSVWALAARDGGPYDLYVIRPEALGS